MKREYEIIGIFHYECHFVDVTVGVVKAENKEEAVEIAKMFNMGDVFCDSATANILHQRNETTKVLDSDTVFFTVLDPRKNGTHETLMGFPIYEKEDEKKMAFNDFVKLLFQESIEKKKTIITFECLAYGVKELEVEKCDIALNGLLS